QPLGRDAAEEERHGQGRHRRAERDLGQDLPDTRIGVPQLTQIKVEEKREDRLAEPPQEEAIKVEARVPPGAAHLAQVLPDHTARQSTPIRTFPGPVPSPAGFPNRSSTSRSGSSRRTRGEAPPPPSPAPAPRSRTPRGGIPPLRAPLPRAHTMSRYARRWPGARRPRRSRACPRRPASAASGSPYARRRLSRPRLRATFASETRPSTPTPRGTRWSCVGTRDRGGTADHRG